MNGKTLMEQMHKRNKETYLFRPLTKTYVVGWQSPKEYNKNASPVFHLDDNYLEPAHHALPGGTIVDFPINESILNADKEKFRKHKKEGTRIIVSVFSVVCSPWRAENEDYITYDELYAPVYKPMSDEEIDKLIFRVYRRYNKYLSRHTKKEQRRAIVKDIKQKIIKLFFPFKKMIRRKREDSELKSFLKSQE